MGREEFAATGSGGEGFPVVLMTIVKPLMPCYRVGALNRCSHTGRFTLTPPKYVSSAPGTRPSLHAVASTAAERTCQLVPQRYATTPSTTHDEPEPFPDQGSRSTQASPGPGRCGWRSPGTPTSTVSPHLPT